MMDAATTPPWLRIPALLLLAAVALRFVTAGLTTLGPEGPTSTRWFATWEMFTLNDPFAVMVGGEALLDGEWRTINLRHLFPSIWESGPRYARSAFYRDPARMRVFGDATCRRLAAEALDPVEVRFFRVVYEKKPGVPSYPAPNGIRHRPLLTWRCGDAVARPAGIRF